MSSRQRSVVSMYFTRSLSNSTVAKCVFCDADVPFEDTRALMKHLRDRHRRETGCHLWNDGAARIQPGMKARHASGSEDDEADDGLVDDTGSVKLNAEQDLGIADDRMQDCRQALAKKRVSSFGHKKSRSVAWKCFRKCGTGLAVCTLCGSTIRQISSSTTNLLKHILNKHPVEYESIVSNKFVMTMPKQCSVFRKTVLPSETCFRPKRRSRSVMWKYFAKCASDHSRVLCTFCGRMLKQPLGSTSNLVKHLLAKHHREYGRMFPEDSREKCDENLDETDEDEFGFGSVQAKKKILNGNKGVSVGDTQMKLPEDEELISAPCDLEEESEIDDTDMSEMIAKVQPIWRKYCDERERQFTELMTAKQKEIEDTCKSVEKLQQQLNILAKEVEQHELRRKEELGRQEKVEFQFLLEKEALSRKWKYKMAFLKTCSLLESALNGETSTSNQKNFVSGYIVDNFSSNHISSPIHNNDDGENIAFNNGEDTAVGNSERIVNSNEENITVCSDENVKIKNDTEEMYFHL